MSVENETTNISDLRMDPVGGGASQNVVVTATETRPSIPSQPQGPQPNSAPNGTPGINLDESTINQIVSGINQANASGMTQLNSRDIPMNPSQITTDPNITPNYVPMPESHEDYLEETPDNNYIFDNMNKKIVRNNNIDDLYNDMQTPLLLAILYFLFQMPFFKTRIYKLFPMFYAEDGNMKINGMIFVSILFAMTYYILYKTQFIFSKF